MTDNTTDSSSYSSREIRADSPFSLPGFFSALADGTLFAGVCTICETRLLPPRPFCYQCGGRSIQLESQPQTGELIAFTEVRRPPSAFEAIAPYTVGIVELDSGARLTGRIDEPYETLHIGDRVQWTVQALDIDPTAIISYETEWPIHVFKRV